MALCPRRLDADKRQTSAQFNIGVCCKGGLGGPHRNIFDSVKLWNFAAQNKSGVQVNPSLVVTDPSLQTTRHWPSHCYLPFIALW